VEPRDTYANLTGEDRERMRDAAPSLLRALVDAEAFLSSLTDNPAGLDWDEFDAVLGTARAAIGRAVPPECIVDPDPFDDPNWHGDELDGSESVEDD
jgi:hypothetical protein